MQPYHPRYVADPELRSRARKKVKAKREFYQHLTSYAIVMAALVMIWLVSGGGYFWPIWPMLGWGIGLAFHAAALRWDRPVTEEEISTEADRLRRLEGPQDTT